LDKVLGELGSTLLKDTVADELGNPGKNVNKTGDLVGIRVGGKEGSGVLGESEEKRSTQ